MSFRKKLWEILNGNGEKFVGWVTILMFVGFIAYGFWWGETYEFRCFGESKVEAILELKRRDAIILLENGMKVEVNQARLKVGDGYCYDSRKVKIEE